MLKEIKVFTFGSIGTNCYLFIDENKDCVIVDCDYNAGKLIKCLEENELNPLHILLTHGHSDHIGGVEEIVEKYRCQVVIGEKEQEILSDPAKNLSAMMGNPISIKADIFVNEGDEIQAGGLCFKVIETPGHTPGSVCYIIDDVLLSGDTLFGGSCGRTDFYGGNWNEMQSSLAKIKALKGDYRLLPGHMKSSTLQRERLYNPYMQG